MELNDIYYTHMKMLQKSYNENYLLNLVDKIPQEDLKSMLKLAGVKYKSLKLNKSNFQPPAYIKVGDALSKILDSVNMYAKEKKFDELENFLDTIDLYQYHLAYEKYVYANDIFFRIKLGDLEREFILLHEALHLKNNYFFNVLTFIKSLSETDKNLIDFCMKIDSGKVFNILADYSVNKELSKKVELKNMILNRKFFFHYVDDEVLSRVIDLDKEFINSISNINSDISLYDKTIKFLYIRCKPIGNQKLIDNMLNNNYISDMINLDNVIKKYIFALTQLQENHLYVEKLDKVIENYNNIIMNAITPHNDNQYNLAQN